MKKIIYTFIYLVFCQNLLAQNAPKREFRAAWIATVSNIDWPSAKGLSSRNQQAEFINLLDQHKQAGINAVIVQIRTNGDALYPSEIEPWSEWLSGQQGQAPNPVYDPMAFMVAEAHKRGMEFHAWFNPYRAVPNVLTSQLAAGHIGVKKPEWLLPYGNLRILDPGKPEVREHVTKVVMEVVRKYDIDGVHFDDYFYPYPATGLTLNDDDTYNKNKRDIVNRGDWRRDNVNVLIKMVSDSIKNIKSYIKFGISPFGIWQNKTANQPTGSATNGLQSYSDIYADTPTWTNQGWVDYIAPQLYWYIGFAVADYSILATWWGQNVSDRHLYIGQAAYRINAEANWNAAQMPTQIRQNRLNSKIKGSIYYNTNSLNKNPLGFRDSLRTNLYKSPSLMPLMAWKYSTPPNKPQNLTAVKNGNGVLLNWQKASGGSKDVEKIKGYVVYRFADQEAIDINKAEAIRFITPNDTTAFTDLDFGKANKVSYVITAIDRLQNESSVSNTVTLELVSVLANESKLEEGEFVNYPNPFNQKTIIGFTTKKATYVKLYLTDLLGNIVLGIIDEPKQAGTYTVEIDTSKIKTGEYIGVLDKEGEMLSRKMLLIR